MERSHIDRDAAYSALRRSSVRTGKPLRNRAEEVLASVRVGPPDHSTSPEDFYG
jgi:hypothetical protein